MGAWTARPCLEVSMLRDVPLQLEHERTSTAAA